jgi:hypothetical protein
MEKRLSVFTREWVVMFQVRRVVQTAGASASAKLVNLKMPPCAVKHHQPAHKYTATDTRSCPVSSAVSSMAFACFGLCVSQLAGHGMLEWHLRLPADATRAAVTGLKRAGGNGQ